MELIALVVGLVIVIGVLRLVGAWMLRINDIIRHQVTIINNMNVINQNLWKGLKLTLPDYK